MGCPVMSLPATIPVSTTDVKEGDALVQAGDCSGVELSSAAKKLYKVREQDMTFVCFCTMFCFEGCKRPWSTLVMIYLRECKL